jgi:hypothetical protein
MECHGSASGSAGVAVCAKIAHRACRVPQQLEIGTARVCVHAALDDVQEPLVAGRHASAGRPSRLLERDRRPKKRMKREGKPPEELQVFESLNHPMLTIE